LRAGAGVAGAFAGIDRGLEERGAEGGELAHTRRRATLLAVDPLGVLAARHLHRRWRAGKPDLVGGAAGPHHHGEAAATDQVGRARQDQRGGDAAGHGTLDLRVLRPVAVFGTGLGGDRRGGLVAVVVGAAFRCGVHPEVRVGIDDAGRDHLAPALDDAGPAGDGHVGAADPGDGAALEDDGAALDATAGGGEDGGAADHDGLGAGIFHRLA
jgi:hypothetical protein